MAFRFYCPQGHVLEGDESQMGQHSQCPLCGTLFVVPTVAQGVFAGHDLSTPQPAWGAGAWPAAPSGTATIEIPPDWPSPGYGSAEPAAEEPPLIRVEPRQGASAAAAPAPEVEKPAPVVHIPCPRGHELETPREMIGQDAQCPVCQAEFRLRLEDSVEHRAQEAEKLRQRDERFNRFCIKFAIGALVLVILMVAGVFIARALGF
jgi:hypothetical protein